MRKVFKHNLVPEVSMTSVTTDEGRYYSLEDGRRFRSVTTVLGEKLDKTGLMEWKARVGEEEAAKVSQQAARRGTAIHDMAEKYVLNEENYIKGHMPVNVETFKQIKFMLDKYVDNLMGIELPLFSEELNTAGRTDLIAEFNGVPSVVDFKTSRKKKKEEYITSYFLQTTVYGMMFENIYNIDIPQVAILIATDEAGPQKFVRDKSYYVSKVREIFS